jgi:hypothetical protein
LPPNDGGHSQYPQHEHAFVTPYAHFIRAEGWRETRAFFDSVPVFARPRVIGLFRRNIRAALRLQGTLQHSDNEIMGFGIADWAAILGTMFEGPYFIGESSEQYRYDAFGALATTVFTSVQSPISDYLRTQPKCMAYAERMMAKYFPEFAKFREPE